MSEPRTDAERAAQLNGAPIFVDESKPRGWLSRYALPDRSDAAEAVKRAALQFACGGEPIRAEQGKWWLQHPADLLGIGNW